MKIAIITGSAGLVGSESALLFHEKGYRIVGIDNDLRARFFGQGASTAWRRDWLAFRYFPCRPNGSSNRSRATETPQNSRCNGPCSSTSHWARRRARRT